MMGTYQLSFSLLDDFNLLESVVERINLTIVSPDATLITLHTQSSLPTAPLAAGASIGGFVFVMLVTTIIVLYVRSKRKTTQPFNFEQLLEAMSDITSSFDGKKDPPRD